MRLRSMGICEIGLSARFIRAPTRVSYPRKASVYMNRNNHRKGFTLVEMLVVIAIIAILVAIIRPGVSIATTKARAATDAANLRSVLGQANALLLNNTEDVAAAMAGATTFSCATYPGAEAYIAYQYPGFIEPFYVKGGQYYSLEYFADIAANGSTSIGTAQPSGYTMYKVGG